MKRILCAGRRTAAVLLLAAGLMLFPRLSGGALILAALLCLPGRRPLLRLIPAVLLTAAVLLIPGPVGETVRPIPAAESVSAAPVPREPDYILNISSGKFHLPECPSVDEMRDRNREPFYGSRAEAVELGYSPCGRCKP